MNDVFFEELGIPPPHANLACGGGSHADQTARIMVAFETELLANRPDWVVVVGDVNSTLACSIVAKKLGVRVAHIEAGLRSGDRAMPEEINRLVTDAISDLFFVTEPSGRVLGWPCRGADRRRVARGVSADVSLEARAPCFAGIHSPDKSRGKGLFRTRPTARRSQTDRWSPAMRSGNTRSLGCNPDRTRA